MMILSLPICLCNVFSVRYELNFYVQFRLILYLNVSNGYPTSVIPTMFSDEWKRSLLPEYDHAES
jgi:hypothetical protein